MYGRRDGFALLEVLVVVSIIALLASVTLANVSSARAWARDTVRISDLKLIGERLISIGKSTAHIRIRIHPYGIGQENTMALPTALSASPVVMVFSALLAGQPRE